MAERLAVGNPIAWPRLAPLDNVAAHAIGRREHLRSLPYASPCDHGSQPRTRHRLPIAHHRRHCFQRHLIGGAQFAEQPNIPLSVRAKTKIIAFHDCHSPQPGVEKFRIKRLGLEGYKLSIGRLHEDGIDAEQR